MGDTGRFLMDWVREGELAWDRLELAAFLGSKAACEALGTRLPEDDLHAVAWIKALSRYGQEALARAAIACARLALDQARRSATVAQHRRLLQHAERWAVDPTQLNEQLAQTAYEEALKRPNPSCLAFSAVKAALAVVLPPTDFFSSLRSSHLMHLVPGGNLADDARRALFAYQNATYFLQERTGLGDEVVQAWVREAIREEVAPWALGVRDPIAARELEELVAATQSAAELLAAAG